MAAQNDPGQAAFTSDATLLLQALLASPATPHKSYRDLANVGARALHAPGMNEAQALLQTLLATPLPSAHHFRPATPQVAKELRGIALKDRLRRDRFDILLSRAERSLIMVALLALGSWATLGPAGNWLYKQYALQASPVPARSIAPPGLQPKPTSGSLAGYSLQPRLVDDPSRDQTAMAPEVDYLAQRPMSDRSGAVDLPAQPTHLLIESIGIDTPIVEVFFVDGDWQVARYAAGYLHDTGLPGDSGNVVIAGHAGFFGGIFADLGTLAVGDDVYIDAAGWRYHYRIRESIVVWPTQTEFLRPTDIPILTLITCTNWDLNRLVVIADFVSARPL